MPANYNGKVPHGADLPGTSILQYRVISRLGSGGMGQVYLAEDTRLGRQVALKFLAPSLDMHADARARLVREAQVAARLRSPHIAVAYDLVEHEQGIFIAMEFVEGELLSSRIARGPLTVADSLDIAMQVADALDEAHGLGIVHRDIKSGNLMITARQLVKVLDFGLAKAIPSRDGFATEASLTMAGMVVGTLNYMPPEQLRGGEVDHRADLFSLGVVLYEMLTSRLPFAGESMAEVADRILNREPEAIGRYSYSVPAEVESIVRKALEKDPAFRYQSAREFYVDLANARRRLRDQPFAGSSVWRGPIDFSDPAAGLPGPMPGPSKPIARSVAVLTFTNITGDPADEWIGQGIAESLTADFAKIGGLLVIPREHVFDLQRNLPAGARPADDRQSLELGRRLGASFVVAGGYQRIRDRVRITGQVVDVTTNESAATVKLDGTIDQIFELQDQLVQELARSGMAHEIGSSERHAIEGDTDVSVEAFEAYSRGMLNLRMASTRIGGSRHQPVRARAGDGARLRRGDDRARQRARSEGRVREPARSAAAQPGAVAAGGRGAAEFGRGARPARRDAGGSRPHRRRQRRDARGPAAGSRQRRSALEPGAQLLDGEGQHRPGDRPLPARAGAQPRCRLHAPAAVAALRPAAATWTRPSAWPVPRCCCRSRRCRARRACWWWARDHAWAMCSTGAVSTTRRFASTGASWTTWR